MILIVKILVIACVLTQVLGEEDPEAYPPGYNFNEENHKPINKNGPKLNDASAGYINYNAFYFQNPFTKPITTLPQCSVILYNF